jgi:heat-inducible transcriptional repressor
MLLDERKAAILRAVVECHIRTGLPVSSSYVAEMTGLGVSPATVRNDMAALEQEGYLSQPHSSAGRVPTDKGYRFFVDSLSGPAPLEPAQAELVRLFFARTHGEIERLLAETSGLLSRLTDYAAVVVGPSAPEPWRVRSVHLVRLAPHLVLAVAVLANGLVERRAIETPSEVSETDVERATSLVAAWLDGASLDKIGLPAPSGDATVDSLASAAVEALRHPAEPEGGHVFVGGAARMAAAFDAVGTIRAVLEILEQQYVLVSLLKDVIDRGLTVAIGTEHGVTRLADCSVVVAPYQIGGERAGTVGILGPTRMHYEQALAAVGVVSRKLSETLSEVSGEPLPFGAGGAGTGDLGVRRQLQVSSSQGARSRGGG